MRPCPTPTRSVAPTARLKGLAESASELRRHALDRVREGDVPEGERLLVTMDDLYAALVTVDLPDVVTNGLRRSLDAPRAVLEGTRGDVTTAGVQMRLWHALETHVPRPS